MKTKEEILAKRIIKFPEEADLPYKDYTPMKDADIKRNVYAAMDEYAKQVALAFYEYEESVSPEQMEHKFAQFIESQNKGQ